jgi:hypothetical protein
MATSSINNSSIANPTFTPGDSAKGAKLFQVSSPSVYSSETEKLTLNVSRLAVLSATPSRAVLPTRSAPTCTASSAVRPARPTATPTPTPTSRPVSLGTRPLW